MRRIGFILLTILALSSAACGDKTDEEAREKPARTPDVTDGRDDLILTWFASGGAQTASSVADVPEDYRKRVRVQDPTIPPEETDPSFVFIADLRKAGGGGNYPVEAVPRAKYEQERKAARDALMNATPTPGSGGGIRLGPDGKPPIIMYSTTTCPVCVSARRWLIDQGIPFTEKDVGKDRAAAAELAAKGKAQGVPTTGVPVFDVGGMLIPGFDKDLIRKLLAAPSRGPSPAPTPAPPGLPKPPADRPLIPKPGPPQPPIPPDPPVAGNPDPTPVDKDKKMKKMLPLGPTQAAI